MTAFQYIVLCNIFLTNAILPMEVLKWHALHTYMAPALPKQFPFIFYLITPSILVFKNSLVSKYSSRTPIKYNFSNYRSNKVIVENVIITFS